jgi:hypothetical protein
VGGFMGWAKWGKRWIGLLGGRGGRNQRFPPFGPAVFGVPGPCAGVTTRSVWGRIVVLAADRIIEDRPISPRRGHLWPKQTRLRASTSNSGSRTRCPGFGGAHAAPKLRPTTGLQCHTGDSGQILRAIFAVLGHFGHSFGCSFLFS